MNALKRRLTSMEDKAAAAQQDLQSQIMAEALPALSDSDISCLAGLGRRVLDGGGTLAEATPEERRVLKRLEAARGAAAKKLGVRFAPAFELAE